METKVVDLAALESRIARLESRLAEAENEAARAPFEENWISFAEKNQVAFDLDLMYFGDDGKPVFMPPADEPATSLASPYRPDGVQTLEPKPPVPYRTFDETFEY
jgi:hypothetical protein